MKKYDLLIFDVDGTLVVDYDSDILPPEVTNFFKGLSNEGGPVIALATNQGGVGLRQGFGDPEKLPTQEKSGHES